MITFDAFVLLITAIGAVLGLMRGFVRQVLSIIGVLIGFYLAYKFSGIVALWCSQQFEVSRSKAQIILYIVLVFGSSILAMLLARALEKLLKIALLSWLNRLAGMILGAVLVILILAALLYSYHALELKTGDSMEKWLADSASYNSLLDLANFVYPYLKF